MPLHFVASGTLEGVEVRAAPIGGVVWDAGRLHHVGTGRVAWSVAIEVPPLLAVAGRRLYLASERWLACLDARTGALAWEAELEAAAVALDAHADGVDVLTGERIEPWSPRGEAGAPVATGQPGRAFCRPAGAWYVATADGLWRLDPPARPALLFAAPPLALHDRGGALQALVAGPSGTLLVEDDGLPLVWPFPEASTHHVAPWGAAEWAVAPRAGRGGVWVVDRRLQTRWKVSLPGVARGLVVGGRAVVVLLDDGEPTLAVTHPDVSEPLLLAIGPVEALHAAGDRVYLTHAGRTEMYHLRETP